MIAPQGSSRLGWVKGKPLRFINGHNGRLPLLDRFCGRVLFAEEDECWEWLGAVDGGGYGHLQGHGRLLKTHRVSYEFFVGPIPPELEIDHLCRNRRCVNPAHMEPVMQRENLLRGTSPPAQNARKTHCNHGHEFTPENTYVGKDGWRKCRACDRRRHTVGTPVAVI